MSNEPKTETVDPFEKVNRELVKRTGMTIYRVFILIGMVALLWLNSNYVKRDEFTNLSKDVNEINTTLRVMAQQENMLRDHETRLRYLELKAK